MLAGDKMRTPTLHIRSEVAGWKGITEATVTDCSLIYGPAFESCAILMSYELEENNLRASKCAHVTDHFMVSKSML